MPRAWRETCCTSMNVMGSGLMTRVVVHVFKHVAEHQHVDVSNVATDNERYLVDMISRGLSKSKSNARAYHVRNISEYRPQAKGVERAVYR